MFLSARLHMVRKLYIVQLSENVLNFFYCIIHLKDLLESGFNLNSQ